MVIKKVNFIFIYRFAMVFLALPPIGLNAQGVVPDLENRSSSEVVQQMGLGWNLGNTMECAGDWIKGPQISNFETAWGNPVTTKDMIDAVQAAGFKSIRIPVAWSNNMGADYTIDPALLKRVRQIVDWALADGMIVVVNIHWDGGWWSKFPVEYDKCMNRYKTMWSQIAGYFKDYPCTLILESLNEEGCFNDVWNRYGPSDPVKKLKAFGILNHINQTFVYLVRKSGGMNAKRHLLIAGYATDIELTTDPDFIMPKDPENHLILSVHYYTPYTFAGLEHDESWGKARSTWGTKADFDELDGNMQKLKARFLDHGVPVIMGEYGATYKTKDQDSVRLYIASVTDRIFRLGMCPMLWDPGSHFNRKTLVFNDLELLANLQKVMKGQRLEGEEPNGETETPAAFFTSIPVDVMQQAQKNFDSVEGSDYARSFLTLEGDHLDGYRSVCTLETPQKADLSVVLKIEGSGNVSAIYVSANDPIAVCLGGKLAIEKCPKPPFAPFYELVNVKMNN